ncbi:hypothetical protein FHG87_000072, partial [Trinorchestia longiramus]
MPMFCSKIFHWGNKSSQHGKKDSKSKDHKSRGGNHPSSSGAGPSKSSPLQFQASIQGGQVYPETIDEGESCPYWTHMSCSSSQDGAAPKVVHAIVQPFYSTTGSSISSGSRYDLRTDSRAGSRPHTPGGAASSLSSMSRPMSPSSRPHTPGSVSGSATGSFCGSFSQTPPPLPPHHPCSPIHQQPSAGVIRSPPGASHSQHQKTVHRSNQHSKFQNHFSPYHSPFQSPIHSPAHSVTGAPGRNSPHFSPNSPLPPIPSQSPAQYNAPLPPTPRSHQSSSHHHSQPQAPTIPPPPQSPLPPVPSQSPGHANYTASHHQASTYNSPYHSPLKQNLVSHHGTLRHSSSHHNALHRSGSAQFTVPSPAYHSQHSSPVHNPPGYCSQQGQYQSNAYHTSVRPHQSSSRYRHEKTRDVRHSQAGNHQSFQQQGAVTSSTYNTYNSPKHSPSRSEIQASVRNFLVQQMNKDIATRAQ